MRALLLMLLPAVLLATAAHAEDPGSTSGAPTISQILLAQVKPATPRIGDQMTPRPRGVDGCDHDELCGCHATGCPSGEICVGVGICVPEDNVRAPAKAPGTPRGLRQ